MKDNDDEVKLNMLLAGDIGGTKTLLGLFDPVPARPRPVVIRSFPTLDYTDLSQMISAFMADGEVKGATARTACFGVAGPVIGDAAELTNVPWRVDATRIGATFSFRR